MRKIGLFGGSFNPPHKGHLHLAEILHDSLALDEVRLIPAKIPPHKSDRDYAPAENRLEMCRLMAEAHDWLTADDFELTQKQISYTYYTAKHFAKTCPEDRLYLLAGGDMLASFTEWYRWKDILQMVTLACIAREEGEYQKLLPYAENLRQTGEIILVNAESFAVSSTKIRDMLRKNQNCSCYLSQNIVKYIKEKNLYTGSGAGLYQVKDKIAFLENRLTPKRFRHSCNVARVARQLAQIYGGDLEKAYFAGLVHDICKEIPFEEQYQQMMQSGYPPDQAELHSKKLWHGIAGAYFIRTEFGIEDEDILNAVRYHTVGRAGMSLLEEIIYMADMISEERDYKGVDKMRRLAQKDLKMAMLEALRDALVSVMKKNGFLSRNTVEAYHYYLLQAQETKDHKSIEDRKS